jgi:hypothetical protein
MSQLCRKLAEKAAVSVRELDIGLWQFSKAISQPVEGLNDENW